MSITVEILPVPDSLDAPGGADFAEMVRVRNAVEADAVGSSDLAYEPAELLPIWQMDEFEHRTLFVARVDGRIVGRATLEAPREAASAHLAWTTVEVLPSARGHGVGGALHDAVLARAIADGRTVLQADVLQGRDDDAERLIPPTRYGSVPADSAPSRFLLARGYRLEQVIRFSRLDLPADPDRLQLLLDGATDAAGPDYRVVTWVGPTPPEHRDAIAEARTRMATDAPSAGLETDTAVWTAERVAIEDEHRAESPRTLLTALAVHEPTGAAAGFTELDVPPELDRPVAQGDTIVLAAHRGRRLGMMLKLANIAHLERELPGHPAITTFNAEENRHMLSVNEAIGFEAVGFEGVWRLDL